MCGIIGGVGKLDYRYYLLTGLRKLDYRGYDSAGLAYRKDGKVFLKKVAGRVDDLSKVVAPFSGGEVGIAHTRWATHGVPNQANAHPHFSMRKDFYIVHNGVIENYRSLKNLLKDHGYVFHTDTDTEVIADLLEDNYRQKKDVLASILETMGVLRGSFACAIICKDDSNLYFMKKASPLLIGLGKGANYLASDALPMVDYTAKFIDLEDGEYGVLTPSEAKIYIAGEAIAPVVTSRDTARYDYDLDGYPTFMLKEIEESPNVIHCLGDNYFDGEKYLFDQKLIKALRDVDEVVFLACGTSYYASLLGVEFMKRLGKRSEAYIGSEWAYYPTLPSEKTIFVLVSQSGETADLILCQKFLLDKGLPTLAITNTKGSTIERKATYSLLLYAGLEVAVAATKSYMAQVVLLALLANAVGGRRNAVADLDSLIRSLRDIVLRKEEIRAIAKRISVSRDAFYVGRGHDFIAALECSLKLKEISYIHAEAYPGGELKHGPIALIEKDTPVIGFVSDPLTALALRNNLTELSSRGATVLIVSSEALREEGDSFSYADVPSLLAVLPEVMFGQYLSYFAALEKKLPIDKPRNLAKSVTVE
ncbi:MAG: glutamine--fructose-6-phosphate transaminase (isomerizing) [Bacilli bacterium]|jgi:glucosamine--fructose-6-phosphate aminotransferase (isomerizing)|nr:glutamine--fructose-6-phosphate transaminase (isomerizing) [Bacilli bacterium]